MINVNKYKLELVREMECDYELIERDRLTTPKNVDVAFREVFRLDAQPEEVFCMITLDAKHNINGAFEVSRGSLSSTLVHPREVYKRALVNNAHAIVVAHNHPSGDTKPSSEDIKTAKRLKEVGELLGVSVLDSLIVTENEFYSFRENELL